MKSSENSILRS